MSCDKWRVLARDMTQRERKICHINKLGIYFVMVYFSSYALFEVLCQYKICKTSSTFYFYFVSCRPEINLKGEIWSGGFTEPAQLVWD